MRNKTITILGINPGTKYLAIAIFRGPELKEWAVKVFKGKWSKQKEKKILAVISSLIDRYEINALAIKNLHVSRSSAALNRLVFMTKKLSERKGLKIYEYSIKELEAFFCEERKINKKKMIEKLVSDYPVLFIEYDKEKSHRNPYYARLFEAVALGAVCWQRLDKKRSHH